MIRFAAAFSLLLMAIGSAHAQFSPGSDISSGKIIANTQTASSYAVQTYDSGKHFDTIGATGTVSFNLPVASRGLNYCFVVAAAQTLNVVAATNEKIAYGIVNSAASGNITSNQIYSTVCIEAHEASQWVVTEGKGTWTVN